MLTHDDLKRLAAVSGPCLTILEPLRNDYSQAARPDAGIAAAIQRADRLLTEKGFDDAERDEMLRPFQKVASNTDWTGRKGSLAMFRAPGFTMANFWPDALAPRIYFGQEFLLLPLLPGFQTQRDFWLLTLSIKSVRLFRGSSNGLIEVVLPRGIPRSLLQDEAFDQPDHTLRGRSTAGPSMGRMKGVQFGMTSSHELQADYLHDFFKAIDRGIHPILAEDRQPLILAGVTRELAIYRRVNTYPDVLAGAVHGSPEALGADALYARATELMAAYSARATATTLREMDDAACRGLLVSDPVAVIDAANAGQIEELVVSPEASGFDLREEVINFAALATIRHSGRISVMNGQHPPAGLAAIVRYRATGQDDSEPPQYASGKVVQLH